MRIVRLLCCVAALTAFVTPSARADQYDKLTYLTFSGPVQIPGATLAPGTYMFKLADSQADRHIVQIFDKAGSKLYATLLAVPDFRVDTPDKNIVLFGERATGTPQAVKAWWYPGDSTGEEFVYPKSQAMKIARRSHESVLSMNDEGSADRRRMKSAKVGRVNESGQTAQSAQAPATPTETATPSGTSGSAASSTTDRSAPSTTSARSTSRRHLPRTGSELPLAELLAGLAFAGAAGTHQLRKRSADRT